MRKWHLGHGLLALALVVSAVTSADATTLRRMGLDDLARTNEQAVVGRVIDVNSYWNADGSFILSDVTVAVDRVIKGNPNEREITVTLMGGTVGETTTMIVAGAELAVGREYILFLNTEDLPAAPRVTTVRDHCQGTFEVVRDAKGDRALSQARNHPLLTDDFGLVEPPGGKDGLPLDDIIREVGRLARTR